MYVFPAEQYSKGKVQSYLAKSYKLMKEDCCWTAETA